MRPAPRRFRSVATVDRALAEAVEDVAPLAERAGVRLVREKLPEARGDAAALRRVFETLLAAMVPDGTREAEIWISGSASPPTAVIELHRQPSGRGIARRVSAALKSVRSLLRSAGASAWAEEDGLAWIRVLVALPLSPSTT